MRRAFFVENESGASDPFSPSNVLVGVVSDPFSSSNVPFGVVNDLNRAANDPNRHPNVPNLTFNLHLKPYKKPKSIDFGFEPFVKMKR